MKNVYDYARPILFVMSLFGVGASRIMKWDGVYSLRNDRSSKIVAVLTPIYTLWFILQELKMFFNGESRSIVGSVTLIVEFFVQCVLVVTVTIGCIMTCVGCKDLNKVFQIINNIDSTLQRKNIEIKHRKINLAFTVLGLLTVNYDRIGYYVYTWLTTKFSYRDAFMTIVSVLYHILFHLYYMWVILFLLIIYERFDSINKLFLQNASVKNIRTVGIRNLRNDYLLRRISTARELDVQLSEAIVLFSNVFRYIIAGILASSIIETLYHALYIYSGDDTLWRRLRYIDIFTHCLRIVILISICEAYKNKRRVLTARLRHLISHETDRRIIQQVQQYIMFNAIAVTGPIDFQFTEVDNVLLFTIIDVIFSNALIIYWYDKIFLSGRQESEYSL